MRLFYGSPIRGLFHPIDVFKLFSCLVDRKIFVSRNRALRNVAALKTPLLFIIPPASLLDLPGYHRIGEFSSIIGRRIDTRPLSD